MKENVDGIKKLLFEKERYSSDVKLAIYEGSLPSKLFCK